MNKQVKKVCEFCGKEFYVIKSREKTAHYCSKECSNKARKALPNCQCDVCGKEFHRKPSHISKEPSLGNFCSVACLNKAKSTAYKGAGNHQYGLKGPLNASFIQGNTVTYNHKLKEIKVYCPNHPHANKAGRVCQHRLVVEQNYQRFNPEFFEVIDGIIVLKKDVQVHHLDGNHENNTIENLYPCYISEHIHIHNKNREIIRDSKGKITAVIKRGELLETQEVGNQQPSQPLTKLEGSETNS